MATCRDCLHDEACRSLLTAMGYTVDGDGNEADKRCDTFKTKTKYAEVVHGRWNRKQIGKYTGTDEVVCSCCGYFLAVVCTDIGFKEAIKDMDYCPNCGAKMDGDGNA